MTISEPATATVGVTSATVLAASSSREGLIIRNTSTGSKTISLGLEGYAAILNRGITLESGDVFCMSKTDYTAGAITAICSVAAGTLAIQEF